MTKSLLLCLTALVIAACNLNTNCLNKDSFIGGYNKFSNDVREHYRDLEGADWVSIDREFKKYVEKCYPRYKDELTFGEKVDFWKNTLGYGIYRGDNDKSHEFDLQIDLDAELEELSAEGREEIENYIRQELRPDLEHAIDNVVKEVESFGDKIKDWLNNN